MAKTKKRRDRRRKDSSLIRRRPVEEDRRSVAVTVAWMLGTLATCGALVVAFLARLVAGRLLAESADPGLLPALPGLLLLTSCVTGTASLCLAPLVYIFREDRPPAVITVFSVVVCLLPIALLVISAT